MKIRNGFVSNSSSSSFCLGKSYMTQEQIKLFSEWVNREEYADEYCETYIDEHKHYFLGKIGHHDEKTLNYLSKIGVDKEYVSCAC